MANGLLAGLFFAFTCAVSPALVRASSLCHSHAAFACLVVGAEARASRVDLNDTHMHLTTEAKAGEHVVLVVNLVARDNGVLCMRLGTIAFELELVDVA